MPGDIADDMPNSQRLERFPRLDFVLVFTVGYESVVVTHDWVTLQCASAAVSQRIPRVSVWIPRGCQADASTICFKLG